MVKYVLLAIFLVLLGLTGVALYLKPSPPNDGKVHLRWLTPNTPFRPMQAEAFNQHHPHLFVEADTTHHWSIASMQRVIFQCSSGLGPDLFDTVGFQLQNYVESGVVLDITEEAKKMGFSTDAMWPGAEISTSFDGKQYAYPATTGTGLLIYNKNVFDRFHIPYPKDNMTWDELIELGKKFSGIKGLSQPLYGVGGLNWMTFFYTANGQYFSEDGTHLLLEEKPLRRAFELHKDIQFISKITPSRSELNSLSSQGGAHALSSVLYLFTEGSYAMYSIGKYALFNFRHAYKEQEKRLKRWEEDPNRNPSKKPELLRLGSTVLPHFAGEQPCYRLECRTICINSKSTHKQEALEFLKFLSGPVFSGEINRAMDQLPGNPAYASEGIESGIPDLSEVQMQENALAAMKHVYSVRFSPFLLSTDVERILLTQIGRLDSNPDLDIPKLLSEAQSEAMGLMQRNLERDPVLRARYKKLTGTELVREAHEKWKSQKEQRIATASRF